MATLSAVPRPSSAPSDASAEQSPLARYRQVRSWTQSLCEPLEVEDFVVQSMPDASPVKWHLAHTSWFFETFLLAPHVASYRPDPTYAFLFNSYYNSLGKQYARPQRGLLSRPTVDQVLAYRQQVDDSMTDLLSSKELKPELLDLLVVGLNHEQQHQELILTDLKHLLSCNPLRPAYRPAETATGPTDATAMTWWDFAEGLHQIGYAGEGFAFDNEGPRHRTFVESFAIASRPVTCSEYAEFVADDGYRRPELWLSEGWSLVQERDWQAPGYWFRDDEEAWQLQTLAGPRSITANEPICHVSLFEADAFARWAGARLPSEAEWEIAAGARLGPAARGEDSPAANFAEDGHFHPRPLGPQAEHGQLLGDVWEWTRSAYSPYPGYHPPAGALGEYNAKFMNNQSVLRGGSCATPRSHIRVTYRNFFHAAARWQFSGFRLARDGASA